jgi:hypothetical protein
MGVIGQQNRTEQASVTTAQANTQDNSFESFKTATLDYISSK